MPVTAGENVSFWLCTYIMPRNQTYSVASAPAVKGSGLSCRDSDYFWTVCIDSEYFLDSVHRFRLFFWQVALIQIIFWTECIDSDIFGTVCIDSDIFRTVCIDSDYLWDSVRTAKHAKRLCCILQYKYWFWSDGDLFCFQCIL